VLQYGAPVKSGQMLDFTGPYPYENGVNLTFKPREDFCTSGRGSSRDVLIRYHAVALELGTDRIVSVSDRQIQKVEVVCSRDELHLAVPEGPFALSALSLRSSADRYRRSSNATGPNSEGSDADDYVLRLTGINITTVDVAGEPINVTVSTSAGFLTFDRSEWSHNGNPTQGRASMGRGTVSFWATPMNAQAILANLTYQTYSPGSDEIVIQLGYGEGSNCTSSDLMTDGSNSTPLCPTLRRSIPVTAEPDPRAQPESRMLSGLHWQLLQLLVSMICYPALFLAWARFKDSWTDETTDDDSGRGGVDDDDEETVFEPSEPLWIQHRCPETGDYYYESREDGRVTWMAPLHEPYVAWTEPAALCDEEEVHGGGNVSDDDDTASGGEML
jgi:hypothetical protein